MGTPTLLENTNPFLQALSAFKVCSPRERAFGRFRLSVPFQSGIGLLERLRPLSRVLAFSHPLREQNASRSWYSHLTCSCRANGIHQAHHADGFQRMPEGASTGLSAVGRGVAHPSRFSEIFLQHPPWLLHPFFTFMPNFANSYALVMEAFPVFGQVEREHARKDEQIILAGSNIDAIGLRHAEPLL